MYAEVPPGTKTILTDDPNRPPSPEPEPLDFNEVIDNEPIF